MELTKKCVLVFGTGISGIGAAHLLLAKGAEVILYDGNTEKDKDALLAEFPAGSQVRIVLGELPEAEMEQLDLVVMSPGVPCDLARRACNEGERHSHLGGSGARV